MFYIVATIFFFFFFLLFLIESQIFLQMPSFIFIYFAIGRCSHVFNRVEWNVQFSLRSPFFDEWYSVIMLMKESVLACKFSSFEKWCGQWFIALSWTSCWEVLSSLYVFRQSKSSALKWNLSSWNYSSSLSLNLDHRNLKNSDKWKLKLMSILKYCHWWKDN